MRDPEKTYSGSRIQGTGSRIYNPKKYNHPNLDLFLQNCASGMHRNRCEHSEVPGFKKNTIKIDPSLIQIFFCKNITEFQFFFKEAPGQVGSESELEILSYRNYKILCFFLNCQLPLITSTLSMHIKKQLEAKTLKRRSGPGRSFGYEHSPPWF
jgi:hypothetical protein